MLDEKEVSVYVWGEYACFSRPEARVERVSFEVPPASVCRGILEAIFWKPEFRWWIRRVRILRPIRTIPLRRNEVQGKLSKNDVLSWMKDEKPFEPLYADQTLRGVGRTQRQTIALRDVAYEIIASIYQPNGFDQDNPPPKYRECFERRVQKGQCFAPPCLGCREFVANFGPELPEELEEDICPPEDRVLGYMLYDVVHREEERRARFFEAAIRKGEVEYPYEVTEAYWKEVLA